MISVIDVGEKRRIHKPTLSQQQTRFRNQKRMFTVSRSPRSCIDPLVIFSNT